MGARLLSDWLLSPLANINLITQRLDAVDIFKRDYGLRADLRNVLSKAYDLQRLSARIGTGRAGPRDLGSVARTLVLLPEIQAVLARGNSPLLQALSQKIALLPHLRDKLFAALEEQLPLSAKEGGIIKQGYDFDLDELRNISISGKEWMANFQAQEIARTGISSLKVGFNQVFGYFIEITHTHTAKVPPDYQRKQTLKNAERYITPELKEQEEKVLNAQEKLEKCEYELFLQLRELASSHTLELMATAETLAIADVLCSLAELASERGWTRPDIVEKPILDIVDGKHPVLEQTMPSGTFVPNSASLHPEHGMFLLITGPNMGGKSVYIRQVALITLLAHVGSFVPASRVIVGLTDRIFTRVGASDELGRSQSTFMVEMTEAANILNNATASSLVILDEIGRGTSTYDGVSIAWAITEHLHDKVGCRTLFATHYHELAQLEESLKKFKNLRVCVRETPTGIIFLHRIEAGSADQSYGIHVAQRAGVPRPVLDRAKIILADLEERHLLSNEQEGALIRRPKIIQGSLFASTEDPILASLRELDVAKFSSDQLLDLIIRWQKDLRKG
jgi:DNA mismatch repair protein MutS